MRAYSRIAVLLSTAVLCVWALSCYGRVFFTWGSVSNSEKALKALGGVLAYEAQVTVNSGSGHIRVFQFSRPIATVADQVRQAFGITNATFTGETFGLANVTADDKTLTFAVIHPTEEGPTVVFALEQSASEALKNQQIPNPGAVGSIEVYPASRPVFYAADENARMELQISQAGASVGDVTEHFHRQLTSGGWTPLMPVSSDSPRGQLLVSARADDLCCVLISAQDAGDRVQITLLHKRQGMK